jgi:hypothetical protein
MGCKAHVDKLALVPLGCLSAECNLNSGLYPAPCQTKCLINYINRLYRFIAQIGLNVCPFPANHGFVSVKTLIS